MSNEIDFAAIVGFTGTQDGMNGIQYEMVRSFLAALRVFSFHHGDCIGADEQAHGIALDLGLDIEIHPPDNPVKRAFCQGAVKVHPELPYLDRNRVIVAVSAIMIATPGEMRERRRSGTWTTVRYARAAYRSTNVFLPDGSIIP